jgi:hypothetical protein
MMPMILGLIIGHAIGSIITGRAIDPWIIVGFPAFAALLAAVNTIFKLVMI